MIPIDCYSQEFQKGFIINLNQEKIPGKWKENYTSKEGLRLEFITADSKELIWYGPEDILAYGTDNSYLREAKSIFVYPSKTEKIPVEKMIFIECLIKGELSLYFYKERIKGSGLYVAKKGERPQEIYSSKEKILVGEKVYYQEDKQYLKVFSELMRNCMPDLSSFSNKKIVNGFISYYNCKGEAFTQFKTDKVKIKKLGLGLGYRLDLPTSDNSEMRLREEYGLLEKSGFSILYRSSMSRNPSRFYQVLIRYSSFFHNQDRTIEFLNEGRRSRIPISEAHWISLNISFGKKYHFRNFKFNIHGGARVIDIIREPYSTTQTEVVPFSTIFLESNFEFPVSKGLDFEFFIIPEFLGYQRLLVFTGFRVLKKI